MEKDHNPVVILELDRPRELRFGHRAMKRWSAHTGRSISELDTDKMSPAEVEELLYFMLEKDAQRHGEGLRLEDMEDLLDLAPLGVLYEKLAQAVEAAFPDLKPEEDEKNEARAAAGTGRSA